MSFFFTVGTLFTFGGVFDLLDSFLEFFLEGFLEEFSSFVEEEGFHDVECLFVGVDQVAFGEQGFEFGKKELVNGGGG
jgi:hypothetical protein